nr:MULTISPECIES: DUF3592 domain-containing protein [Rhizobium/Agrobacterium group]
MPVLFARGDFSVNKIIKLVGAFLFVFGLAFVATGAGIAYFDRQFYASGSKAKGVVVDLARKSDNDHDGTTYAAIVRFTDARGQQQEMADHVSSNPPRFSRGDTVDVYYDPQSPSNARIDDAFGRYFLPGMFAGMGTLFAVIGGAIIVVVFLQKRRNTWLMRFGRPVDADFLHVFLDQGIEINGANPFRVVAQGPDPVNGTLRRYQSGPIWVDPSAQLQGRKLRVLVDPSKPERHMIDLAGVVNDP